MFGHPYLGHRMVWRGAPDSTNGNSGALGVSSSSLSCGLGHSQPGTICQSGVPTHKEFMRVAVFASAQGTAAALDMSFMLDSTHTSQNADGRIIARNVRLPPPANMTGDRGCPLNYSDWPYETIFQQGNHLRIVDAAFILREQRLCDALGVRRCRAHHRDLDNWSHDVTTFLRYHVGRSPTDKGDRKHPERNGVGLSLDMGGVALH